MVEGLKGRQRELDAVLAGLTQTVSGAGCRFALAGEPGIGKTRLATELSQRAQEKGLKTFWGRAWESGGAPALWPWRQLLEAMGLSVHWSTPGGGDFSTSDPRQARFELFDHVVRALRSHAQPALCVLDDLHAADVASLELLDFALGALTSSPIAWVVTWRDAEAERLPVRDALARASRRCTVLKLGRLSREDCGALVKDLVPTSDAGLADALFQASSGNPLFLCETARAMADKRFTGALPVGQGVALVVRDRVAALSHEARALVEYGAVLGREVLLPPDAATRALAAQVVASGLWAPLGPDRWLFSHALVRDALYSELSPARRAELHARAAGELDGVARALHALEAISLLEPSRVVPWVIAAARELRAQRAYEEAAALLERGARELPKDAELKLALGWSYGDLGNTPALQRTFDEVIALAREAKQPQLLARAVLGRGSNYVLGDIRVELLPLIDEALEGLPESERELRARLWARKASAMTPSADPAEPHRLAHQALAAIAGSNDARAVLDVAVGAGSALGDFGRAAERMEVNSTLVRSARSLEDRVLELRGLSRLVADHLESADVARADAVLLERDALASSLGHVRFRWQTPLFRSMRAMIDGRFDVCEQSCEEAQRLVQLAGDENAFRVLAVHRTWLLLLQDRVDDLRAHEPEVVRRLQGMTGLCDLKVAMIRARAGQLASAREYLKRAAGEHLHFLRAPLLLCGVGQAAVLCGELELARRAHTLLLPHADTTATTGLFGFACWIPVRGVLGYLGRAIGRPEDENLAHFDAALERAAAMEAPAHEVWVRLWRGDREACVALARKLKLPGLEARAGAESAAPPAPAPTAVDFTLAPHESGWRLSRGGQTLVLKDWRGMGMLARLLEHPGLEIHALELVSGDAPDEVEDRGDAGELLDEKAKLAYRRRIEQLSERIEDAEERGDALNAERARTELEALSRELSRAVGLGGRARRAGSAAERARVTAQRRVREAIKRIAELDPEVGAILERTIRTGTFCAFEPNRRARG
jgi:hypothetical protein